MIDAIKEFNKLLGYGLKPVPLRSQTKIPLVKGWNKNWSEEEARVVFKKVPHANIGILLGDVIDVEGDTPAANQLLIQLIGDYPHPHYQSKKSIHHLFSAGKQVVRIAKYNGIEFRGHGHQSVVPPSETPEAIYQWLHWCYPIPLMPTKLKTLLENIKKKRRVVIKPGHIRLYCAVCREKKMLHKNRFELELAAFKELGLPWQCHDCREVDLRKRCRELR